MSKQHARAERASAARRAVGQRPAGSHAPATHPLVAIQRQIGNAQVARMIADIRREGIPEEEEPLQMKRDPQIQRKASGGVEVGAEGGPISGELSGRIQSLRGGGAPLAAQARQRMEQALGSSFADVRVHTGGEAASISRRIGALAFTTGSDVFFGHEASPTDDNLLAHELTHVVQQRGAAPTAGPLTVGAADDSHEQQAEAVAADVASRQRRQP
jgi:hypothetical protein